MKAFYINDRNRLRTVEAEIPRNIVSNKKGFYIPELHHIVAIMDDSGVLLLPPKLQLSDFEKLFTNEHNQADYIGFMQTAEWHRAGLRLVDELIGKQFVYASVDSMGYFQGYDTFFEIWLKLGAPNNYGFRQYRYNKNTLTHTCPTGLYGSEDASTSHKYSIGTAPTDNYPWFAYITYWKGFIESPMAVIIPGDANRGLYPTTKVTIEEFETGDHTTGIAIKEGQAAIDFVQQYGFVWPDIETFKM